MRSIRSSDLAVRVASLWLGRSHPLAEAGGRGCQQDPGEEGDANEVFDPGVGERQQQEPTRREISVLRLILWGRKPRRKGNFERVSRGQPGGQA